MYKIEFVELNWLILNIMWTYLQVNPAANGDK